MSALARQLAGQFCFRHGKGIAALALPASTVLHVSTHRALFKRR
ncbi:hypothetical protein [Duganella fentianensis]